MLRRSLVSGAVGAIALALTRPAFAGSYLDRAALLLDGSRKDQTELRAKIMDKELAKVVRIVAEARLDAASKMDVPPQVAKAHPHLLLALTKVERAAQAAVDGNLRSVVELLDTATREEGVFKSALKELGFPLPRPSQKPAA
ncbi:MAG: hypothetical protein JNK04_10855 [Myxococcales bacterium]|nr:hypothetical protein [Myxococcales bacterium]